MKFCFSCVKFNSHFVCLWGELFWSWLQPWDGSAYDAMCKDRIIVAVNCALGPDSSQKQWQTKQGPQLPLP